MKKNKTDLKKVRKGNIIEFEWAKEKILTLRDLEPQVEEYNKAMIEKGNFEALLIRKGLEYVPVSDKYYIEDVGNEFRLKRRALGE